MSCVSQRRIRSLVPENICTIQRLNVSTSNSLDEVLAFRLGVPTSNFETTTERLTAVVAILHNKTVRIASYLKAGPSKREGASIWYFACSGSGSTSGDIGVQTDIWLYQQDGTGFPQPRISSIVLRGLLG